MNSRMGTLAASSAMPPKWSPCQWVVIRWSICRRPASFIASTMRPASRAAAAPALPVSISSDSREGDTNKVELPPSTSITYTSSVADGRVWAEDGTDAKAEMVRIRARRISAQSLSRQAGNGYQPRPTRKPLVPCALLGELAIHDLGETGKRRSFASTLSRSRSWIDRGRDLIQRLSLRDQFHDLGPLHLRIREPLLNGGLGLHVSMPGDEPIGIESGDAFGSGDPAFRRAVLFQVDQRIGKGRRDDVSGEDDLLVGQINHQIAAGMGRRPVERLDLHSIDLEILFILGDYLSGKMVGRRSAAATG